MYKHTGAFLHILKHLRSLLRTIAHRFYCTQFPTSSGLPDLQIHANYTNLLDNGGEILYGRTTFELMKFWQSVLENPSGER